MSSKLLVDQYKTIKPHEIDRVRKRNLFLIEVLNKAKDIGRKLFENLFLVRFISQRNLGREDRQFKVFEEMFNRSEYYRKVEHIKEEPKKITYGIHTLLQYSKYFNEVPPGQFVVMVEPKPPFRYDELITMFRNHFNIGEDYLLIPHIIHNDLIPSHVPLDDVRKIIQLESESFRKSGGLAVMTKACFMNKISDQLFKRIFKLAVNNLMQKTVRVVKESEIVMKELLQCIYIMKEPSVSVQLISQPTFDEKLTVEYPMASKFNMNTHRKYSETLIRQYAKTVDKLFASDKTTSVKLPEIIQPDQRRDDEENHEPGLNVDGVKKLLSDEKIKSQQQAISNQTGLKLSSRTKTIMDRNKPIPIPERQEDLRDTLWKAKDAFNNQFKEIMGFGTTLRNIKKVMDKQTREAQPLMIMPSITEVKLKNKAIMSQMRKLIFVVKNPITGPPKKDKGQVGVIPVNTNMFSPNSSGMQADMVGSLSQRANSLPQAVSRQSPEVSAFKVSPRLKFSIDKRQSSKVDQTFYSPRDSVKTGGVHIHSTGVSKFIRTGYSSSKLSHASRSPPSSSRMLNLGDEKPSREVMKRMRDDIDSYILSPF